jgi:hypothetical protein
VRHLRLFSSILLVSVIGLTPVARGGDVSAETLWPDAELAIKYQRPPKTIDGDPMESSLLLLQFEFKGIIRMNALDGAALVMAGEGGRVIRAGTMKGRLVIFQLSDPGTYSLQFVKVSNGNSKILLQKPRAVEMSVTVAKGAVSYLGTVVVTMNEMNLMYDAEKEIEAWSTFKQKYAASPWSALAEKRIASLK